MIDYQVYDLAYGDFVAFETLEEAREYIAKQIDVFCGGDSDFTIYKRERIDA